MDAVRLTTVLRLSGREGRLGVDASTDDPVIVAAADAAVGAVAVMDEVLGAEVGNAIHFLVS